MDDKKVNDRFIIIKNMLLIIFAVILVKIVYMASFKYEYYTELAENKTYKEIPIKASRGEIKDRYGRVLATTKNQFTVQVSADGISKTDENKNSKANEISLRLINLLEKNGEEYKDDFPIYVENGKYYYTYDREIKEYKESNGIPQDLNAKESFYYLVDKAIDEGILSPEDKRLEASKLQAKLNKNAIYPPILVSKWMFTAEKNKVDWLASYKIDESGISAEEAFNEIRNYYSEKTTLPLNKGISASDARKVLIVRDLLKSQGYSRYNPVTIAQGIKESTISQIEENLIDMPGVSVSSEPVRYYPNGTLAAHVLGHIGKIPSSSESKYLENGYLKSDLVGLAGIEKSYEEKLRGTDGYKKVQVDALGKITKEIEVSEPESGETVYLTIDKDLQEVAEDSLKRTLKFASEGGTFESQYGNRTSGGTAPNAKSGALIAIDVKTGDVLASVSYPSYDPNLFTKGSVSYEEYKDLEPENKNDYLAPSKQLNLVTQGIFQPGSTFKLITGMAALENGLDPNYTINDTGVVYFGKKAGSRPFADLIWHKSRGNHGATNLYKAIQESCNIYFYTIGSGKNLIGGSSPGIDMGPEKILETAKLFGLNEKTGLYKEIEELGGTVPTMDQKLKSIQTLLKSYLNKNMANDFTDITKEKNPEEFESRVDTIVSWAEEDETPGRVEVINRLIKMKVKEDRAESLADTIVFDYLNQAKWTEADTFNLSIGQGENAYTPAQIARYVAAIANGGNLVDLSVVKKSISSDYTDVEEGTDEVKKIDFKDSDNLKELVEGMKRMTTLSSAKSIFDTLPVSVAAKTGTAEKSGKIPTANEEEYLLSHMDSYGVSKEEAVSLANQLMKEREEELSKERELEIKEKLKDKELDEKERKELEDELAEGVSVKLEDTDKVKSSYLRKAIKELNPKITDDDIDQFKSSYDPFAWSVAFAPADDPEIAVVVMIPQGATSTYALLPVREVIGAYMGLNKDTNETETNEENAEEKNSILEDNNINFGSQIKN